MCIRDSAIEFKCLEASFVVEDCLAILREISAIAIQEAGELCLSLIHIFIICDIIVQIFEPAILMI